MVRPYNGNGGNPDAPTHENGRTKVRPYKLQQLKTLPMSP